jgi:hypothetical protein
LIPLSFVAHLVPDEKDATNMSAYLTLLSEVWKRRLRSICLCDEWRGDNVLRDHQPQSYSMVSLTDKSRDDEEVNEDIEISQYCKDKISPSLGSSFVS